MARHQPTDEQVRAGGGWGVVGLAAVGATLWGMHTGDDRLMAAGMVAVVLVGILGAHGGA